MFSVVLLVGLLAPDQGCYGGYAGGYGYAPPGYGGYGAPASYAYAGPSYGGGYGGSYFYGPRSYEYDYRRGPLLNLSVGRDRRVRFYNYDGGRSIDYSGGFEGGPVYYGRPFVVDEGYGPPPFRGGSGGYPTSPYGYSAPTYYAGGYGGGYAGGYSRPFAPSAREPEYARPRAYQPPGQPPPRVVESRSRGYDPD
jgi:hypothetical protein